ncbi:unnamed protein product [Parajaminaea phylloscopi]
MGTRRSRERRAFTLTRPSSSPSTHSPPSPSSSSSSRRGSWSPHSRGSGEWSPSSTVLPPLDATTAGWRIERSDAFASSDIGQAVPSLNALGKMPCPPDAAWTLCADERRLTASSIAQTPSLSDDDDVRAAASFARHADSSAYPPTAPSPQTLFETTRGRSAAVSPARRRDAPRAAGRSALGGAALGGLSGNESEMTVVPRSGTRSPGAAPHEPSASSSSKARSDHRQDRKDLTTRRRAPAKRAGSRALHDGDGDDDDKEGDDGTLTSSDEEGADASRFARSRRASLEKDRRRGLQALVDAHAATRGSGAAALHLSTDDLERLVPCDGLASASTSTSATPTVAGDDHSEGSSASALSRASSTDGFSLAITAPRSAASALIATAPAIDAVGIRDRRRRRSRLNSGESREAAFFGLADDEEEPVSALLSAQALSSALSRRRSRTRVNSAQGSVSSRVRSVPASRRPSQPEADCLPPAASTSVPYRTSHILGFAPVSSSSPACQRFGTSPRRARQHSAILAILQGSSNDVDADLLSGSSVGSVEDFIKVDKVEWAADDGTRKRNSLVSLRSGDLPETFGGASGDPTVAAVEAKTLLADATRSGSASAEGDLLAARSLPKTPTGESFPSISASGDGGSVNGSAATYQERLSNLQGQLRLWASEPTHGDHVGHKEAASQASSGLFATSWRQISRLPNLLFSAKAKHPLPAAMSSGDDAVTAESNGLPVSSSLSAMTSASSDSSIFSQAGDHESSAAEDVDPYGRRPSVGSRGVVDPVEGDRDPGAYIHGLGHRIDPDVELASVVHLHSFRARGRSVDARKVAKFPASQQCLAERRVASDGETSPPLRPTRRAAPDPSDLHLPESTASSLAGMPPPGPTAATSLPKDAPALPVAKTRARFTLHDDRDDGDARDEDGDGDDDDASALPTHRARSPRPGTGSPGAPETLRSRAGKADADGFVKVVAKRNRSPRCSRPAAESLVPQDFSAFHHASASSEESDADRSRTESESEPRRGSDEDVPRRRRDDDVDVDDLSPVRGRRGRGRGRGSRASRGTSPTLPDKATRSKQCAIGLFSGKTGRREDSQAADANASDSASAASAGVRSIRSSPNLSYAHVAASRPLGAETSSRRSSGRSGSASMSRDNSEEGAEAGSPSRGGRGRGGSVKVTSSSFAPSEHPPNSLPRSASASSLESMARRQTIMSVAALSTGSYSLPPAQPQSLPSPAFVSVGAGSGAGSSSMRSSSTTSSQASASSSGGSLNTDGGSSGAPVGSAWASPARPTLLSNSAHLLMLSLELEMMRAQKISAPLKVRWAKQRASVPLYPASTPPSSDGSALPSDPARHSSTILPDQIGEHGGDLVVPDKSGAFTTAAAVGGAEDSTAPIDVSVAPLDAIAAAAAAAARPHSRQIYLYTYRPHRASNLRHVLNA